MKALKAFNRIIENTIYIGSRMNGKTQMENEKIKERQNDIEIIKKSLKALEFIIKKQVDLEYFNSLLEGYDDNEILVTYNAMCKFKLTKKDLKLLKEVNSNY